jgi:hypothetical protein
VSLLPFVKMVTLVCIMVTDDIDGCYKLFPIQLQCSFTLLHILRRCKNVKQIVAQQRYPTTDDLKQAVRRAFNRVTPQTPRNVSHRTWRRIIVCHENGGAQTDTLDN